MKHSFFPEEPKGWRNDFQDTRNLIKKISASNPDNLFNKKALEIMDEVAHRIDDTMQNKSGSDLSI